MNPAEFQHIAVLEERFWWFRGMRRILFALLDPVLRERPVRSVLEAGCGTGYNAACLARRYGCEVTAVDLEAAGLAHARAAGRPRLVQADIRRLPVRSGAFDALVSLDVIVHLERGAEGEALAEFARVTAPGGLLVLRVAALDVLRSRHSEFAHERQRFTKDRLLRAVERVGFTALRTTYANSLLLPVALAKFRLWEPLLRQAPASGVAPVPGWLNDALERALSAEARWLATGRDLPLGQSLITLARRQG